MGLVGRLRHWAALGLAAALVGIGLTTTAFAQVSGGDADGLVGDEFAVLAVVLAVVAIATAGWAASRRRSTRPR